MAIEKTTETPDKVRVLVDFQPELYKKFQNSVFRRESNTDGEGVRSAIKYLLSLPDATQADTESQEKSSDEVRP